jgi:hypothetical protein
VVANRRNQKLSHGPVTMEGKARISAMHLRHDFYASEASDEDLVSHDVPENKGS